MSSAMRCQPLSRALVASGKNAAKSECLGLMYRAILLLFVAECGLLKLCSIFSVVVLFCFAVSDANVLVESQLCGIVFPKDFFGAFSQFSAAL
ncbi:hypothetical protein [Vibrio sp. B1-2]|uniref:hypothetical protein n=1 Tax=Vibrio sp. B1-2 TaxID=2591465 RepID=UPI001482F8BF|nr:hypothetical protein [Vibrio sp. B1-2]